jgi:hypothetical protein
MAASQSFLLLILMKNGTILQFIRLFIGEPGSYMQHLRSLDHLQLESAWITIGSFDGVHRGHQALIKRLVGEAHQAGHLAVVVTFFPIRLSSCAISQSHIT